MVFENEFSWSKSRDACFRECRRKYWFNYYGYWNGWVASEDERVKRIYYLKKLKTREIWVGERVHFVIEFILKRFFAGEEIGLSRAVNMLRRRMESDFDISKIGGYTGFASRAHRFFEDEYGIDINEKEKAELFDKAELCLRNFYNSDIFMEIRKSNLNDWLTLEDFLSFDFFGTRVFLSIDFAMKSGEEVFLFDWKTGKERQVNYKLQLALYAFYLREKFGFENKRIVAKMFYLALGVEGKVDSFEVSFEDFEDVENILRESILEMRSLLRDPEKNLALEEDFEKSEGFWCSRCQFRRVCLGDWS